MTRPADTRFPVRRDAETAEFHDEFLRFLRDRRALRRYMPTPDCFPLMCELIDEAKKFYVRLPRVQRNTMKYISFWYFGREWLIRMNFAAHPRAREAYIDICNEGRAAMVTVAVGFDNDLLEAVQDE